MTTTDLGLAIEALHWHDTRLVLVRGGNVLYSSDASGIAPYIHAIQSLGNLTRGASLADRTSGRASALLSIYAGIGAIYAETISEGALDIFANHEIPYRYGKLVRAILNRRMDAPCPFEQIVKDTYDPGVAFLRLAEAIG